MKMSYQFRDPNVEDKMASWPSYLEHGSPYTWERQPLYWDRTQVFLLKQHLCLTHNSIHEPMKSSLPHDCHWQLIQVVGGPDTSGEGGYTRSYRVGQTSEGLLSHLPTVLCWLATCIFRIKPTKNYHLGGYSTYLPLDKMVTIHRQHFQMHFLKWMVLYFDSYFT